MTRAVPAGARVLGRYAIAAAGGLPTALRLGLAPAWRDGARVCYGSTRLPSLSEESHGGMVKVQHMQAAYPNAPASFNVLYLVSSAPPAAAISMAWLAKERGKRFFWNQDGVAYAAWHGPGWRQRNWPMARLLHMADYVFYQSRFCQDAADKFLGRRRGPSEILYNAVDTQLFTPPSGPRGDGPLTVLLAGTQSQLYRLETAIRTAGILFRRGEPVRLLVTGRLSWKAEADARLEAEALVREEGLEGRVEFLGPYSQAEGPDIFRRADILLHTKYNDPCPTVVLEAMAAGVPVAYSRTGGVPELVGDEAGVGITAELGWDKDCPPDPELMAGAILQIMSRRTEYSQAARQRAEDRFDMRYWLDRHRQAFERFLG